jgi:two-component system, NtrC family, sensor kinase
MRRRSRAGGKPIKTRRRKAATLGRPNAPKVRGRRKPSSTNANTKNALRERERDELLEQQKATAEVLRIISASPGDLKPVFQSMLENATRLCEAKFGNIFRLENNTIRPVASLGEPEALAEFFQHGPHRPHEDAPVMRVARTKQLVHVVDFRTERAYLERNPLAVAAVELGGMRTLLVVPMHKENELVGAFGIYRQEVRPFSDKQIELVKNFAAQAVIAIENTRLLNELRESLQQQTATAEVLKTISRTAFDLPRVLETLLENAVLLSDAKHGMIFRYDGEYCRATADYNNPPGLLELWQRTPIRAGRQTATGRALLERRPVQITDAQADPDYVFPEALKLQSFRTVLAVPLLREGVPLGTIAMWKTEVAPFTDRQIELVTTFADQAVIAIENVRLLNELRQRTDDLMESLEQQTATSEVLKVISSSPGELEPVFKAVLENAARICQAQFGALNTYDGSAFRNAALHNPPPNSR